MPPVDPNIRTLCRECGWSAAALVGPPRCPACRSPRLIRHEELGQLSIAHIDCDAFYASVEKRDDPGLADKPLIIGGGKRGVVCTACYMARIRGVRSAMPMFKALRQCPDAVVVKPNMAKYVEVSRQIRALFETLTPLVEPLSLDEAFLDLTGADRLHGVTPAESLARLARRIDEEIGVSISIGLAPNKFLAKIASELDKPRGFAIIGAAEAVDFLDTQPVKIIWGVGAALEQALAGDGYYTVGDLRRVDPDRLMKRYGAIGRRLAQLAQGKDSRAVSPHGMAKSVSAEATFNEDISAPDLLEGHLWRLTEQVSARLKARSIQGRVITLKLKTQRFRQVTRRVTLDSATDLADRIYRAAQPLLAREAQGAEAYRLIGVGASDLSDSQPSVSAPADLFDPGAQQRAEAERAMDALREKFGRDVIVKGRSLR